MAAFVFVHSPLVGPHTWIPVAKVASEADHPVAIPDLTVLFDRRVPSWDELLAAAEQAAPPAGPVSIVGHSGAGALLPLIAERLEGRCASVIFVDAVVPPLSGDYRTPDDMRRRLGDLAEDGLLPKWSTWWGEGAMERLVPDPEHREILESEMPCVPLDFYDQTVPVPDGWMERRCSYVRLSAAYDDELADVRERGWPVVAFDGTHLSLVTEPELVWHAIATVDR